jgi:sodium-dependent phosphate cotransporter
VRTVGSSVDGILARGRSSGPLAVGALVSLTLFLFAVQLLGASTAAAAPPLERFFGRHVAGGGQALGASWLATYVLTNGSVVAALSVSLFEAGVVTAAQLFLMLAGSRLGGAAVVLLIGALEYVRKRRHSFGEATGLGTLTFLVSHSVYLPATALGYPLLGPLSRGFGPASDRVGHLGHPLASFAPATDAAVGALGVGPALVAAIAALFVSLSIFDRVLKRVDTEWLRTRFFRRFGNRWTAFGLGALVTGVTTSVAFSLGVAVPLYNRDYVTRREVVPYVLGANVGTFVDTVAVAVLLDSPRGVAVVLSVVAVGAVVTVGSLVWFPTYVRAVERVQTRLVTDRRYLTAFLLSLVAAPVVLVLLPV